VGSEVRKTPCLAATQAPPGCSNRGLSATATLSQRSRSMIGDPPEASLRSKARSISKYQGWSQSIPRGRRRYARGFTLSERLIVMASPLSSTDGVLALNLPKRGDAEAYAISLRDSLPGPCANVNRPVRPQRICLGEVVAATMPRIGTRRGRPAGRLGDSSVWRWRHGRILPILPVFRRGRLRQW
jgi:hypothetical protein